jgi:hypothetical protein
MTSECNRLEKAHLVKMRENWFPRDRHANSTRDKRYREKEKRGFGQDLGVLRGFRAGFMQDYAHSALFVPQCNRLYWGLIDWKGGNKKLPAL